MAESASQGRLVPRVARLFRPYRGRVGVVIAAILSGIGETFLGVFGRLASFSGTEPQFRSWVFTIAANLARDEARTEIRRRKHLALIKDDDVATPTPAPAAPSACCSAAC